MTMLFSAKKIPHFLFMGACIFSLLRVSAMEVRERESNGGEDSTRTTRVNTTQREVDAAQRAHQNATGSSQEGTQIVLDRGDVDLPSSPPSTGEPLMMGASQKRENEAAFGISTLTLEEGSAKKTARRNNDSSEERIEPSLLAFSREQANSTSGTTVRSEDNIEFFPSFLQRKMQEYQRAYDLLLQKIRRESPALANVILLEELSKTPEEQRLFSQKCAPLIEALPHLTVVEQQQMVSDVLKAIGLKTALRLSEAMESCMSRTLRQMEFSSQERHVTKKNIKNLQNFRGVAVEIVSLVEGMTVARNEAVSLSPESINRLIEGEKSGFLSLCYASLCAEKLFRQEIQEASQFQDKMFCCIATYLITHYEILGEAAAARGDHFGEEKMLSAANEAKIAADCATRAAVIRSTYGDRAANCLLLEAHGRIYLAKAKREGNEEKITNLSAAANALETAGFYFVKGSRPENEEHVQAGSYSLRASEAYTKGDREQGSMLELIATEWSKISHDRKVVASLKERGCINAAEKYSLAAEWSAQAVSDYRSGNQRAGDEKRSQADISRSEGEHEYARELGEREQTDASKDSLFL